MNNNKLSRQDYKTLTLASLGGALEFYDFIIFVFFATVIGDLFFPPDMPEWGRLMQTFGIFAAGYFARPLGGIVMAHFGDLVGRKKMFTLSILMMAVPTLIMGALPTYASIGIAAPLLLLLMRIFQGMAIGGEVPGAWVFVAEHVAEKRVGFACGVLTSGLTLGILLGSFVATVINQAMTATEIAEGGWRIPFFLGGLFGLLAMYMRRWLQETPIFIEMQKRKALSAELPLKSVVKQHLKPVVISMLLTWLLSAGIVVVILMTPSYLKMVLDIPPTIALQANSLAIIGLSVGCIVMGSCCDFFGSGRTFVVGSLLMAISCMTFYWSAGDGTVMLFLTYILAGFSVGIVGAVPFVMVRVFPAVVRFSGISFSYNIAYAVFGGISPILVTKFTSINALAPAYYVLLLSGIGFLLGVYLWRSDSTEKSITTTAQ